MENIEDIEEEIDCLKAIYGDEAIQVENEDEDTNITPTSKILYNFNSNDSNNGSQQSDIVTFQLASDYPDSIPFKIHLHVEGLGPEKTEQILLRIQDLARDAVGGCYLFELIEAIRIDFSTPKNDDHDDTKVPTISTPAGGGDSSFSTTIVRCTPDDKDFALEIVLPPEILDDIFNRLSNIELRNAALCCRQWRSVAETNKRWQTALDKFYRFNIGFSSFRPRKEPAFLMTFYHRLKTIKRRHEVDGVTRIVKVKYYQRGVRKSRVIKLKNVTPPTQYIKVCPTGGYGPIIGFDNAQVSAYYFIVWTFELVKLDASTDGLGERRYMFGMDGQIYKSSAASPMMFYPFDSHKPTWEEVSTISKI